jgi:hypothetical protein
MNNSRTNGQHGHNGGGYLILKTPQFHCGRAEKVLRTPGVGLGQQKPFIRLIQPNQVGLMPKPRIHNTIVTAKRRFKHIGRGQIEFAPVIRPGSLSTGADRTGILIAQHPGDMHDRLPLGFKAKPIGL